MSSCTNLIDHRCEVIYVIENIWFVFLYIYRDIRHYTLGIQYAYT